MWAVRAFGVIGVAVIVWLHTIPFVGTSSYCWIILAVIAVVSYILMEITDKPLGVGCTLGVISIFAGFGFLAFDVYHFLKFGTWHPSTLGSVLGKYLPGYVYIDWQGLMIIASWLWSRSLWWWIPLTVGFIAFLWTMPGEA